VVRDIAQGEAFSKDNVRAIRPGLGLAPKHIDTVLGRTARHALKRGTALSWDVVG
jgi:N-acetylneuraminate synthase